MIAGQLAALTASARPAAAPPPSYTGPLDLTATPAVVAYGQRAMSAAKLGTAVYTIRRSSDDTTQSFSSDATTGVVDAAAITAFIGGGNGFVSTWNDQSGNASNALQATAGKQPGWTANSGANSRPAVTFVATNHTTLASSGNVSLPNGAMTVFFVGQAGNPGNQSAQIFNITTSNVDPVYAQAYVGGLSGAAYTEFAGDIESTNEVFSSWTQAIDLSLSINLVDFAIETAVANGRVNNAAATQSDSFDGGAVDAITKPIIIGDDLGTQSLDGPLLELLVFPTILSDADRLAIRQNIATYYGITLS